MRKIFEFLKKLSIYLLLDIPELNAVIGQSACDEFIKSENENSSRELLKKCFSNLMKAPVDKVQAELAMLVARLQAKSKLPFCVSAILLKGVISMRLFKFIVISTILIRF